VAAEPLAAEERQGHDDKSRSATRAWAHDAVWRSGEDAGGKCSFDKGITLSIPISWATGTPTRDRASTTIRSLSRDGGARLVLRDGAGNRVRVGAGALVVGVRDGADVVEQLRVGARGIEAYDRAGNVVGRLP